MIPLDFIVITAISSSSVHFNPCTNDIYLHNFGAHVHVCALGLLRVRVDITGHARTKYVGKYQ